MKFRSYCYNQVCFCLLIYLCSMQSEGVYYIIAHIIVWLIMDTCYTLYTFAGWLLISPSEEAVICHGEQLELTCTTNATFLRWISLLRTGQESVHTYSRYISSIDATQQASSISINSIFFNVSRVSHQGRMPLVSRLLINPVSFTLNGTKLNCTEVDGADKISMVSTTVLIIGDSCEH